MFCKPNNKQYGGKKLVFNEMKNGEINARVISDTFDIPLSISYRVMKR